MQFKRSDRVSELLRSEISRFVQEISDPRLGFVTITSVKITDDLMDAQIFYSVLGSPEEQKISSQILVRSVPALRYYIGRKLESLRKVPVLKFVYDDTAEKAQKVGHILKELSGEIIEPLPLKISSAEDPSIIKKKKSKE